MMRITAIEFLGVNVTAKTNWCFLLVRTEGGLTGTGECTLADHEASLAAEVGRITSGLIEMDALARNRIARLIPHAPGALVTHAVVSALEQALWDIAAQAQGVPLHAALGGALREAVPLYANINRGADPRTPEGFAAAAQRAVAAGFRAVKLAPFEPMVWEDAALPGQRAAYAQGLARIAAVRAAVGAEVDVMVDAHWRFSPGGAAALIRDLAPFNLFWLECPVSEANHGAIRRLRSLAHDRGMRLAGAETLAGLGAYRAIIEAGCYDVLMPDIKYAGGHEEIRRIAALAQTAGMEIAPHNPTGPICHAHSVQLCATLPNLLPLEVQFGETERFFTMTKGHDQHFMHGTATLHAAAGLGVALEEEGARATPWQPMERPWLDPRLG
jgi:galactonate dehydratase